MKFSTFLYLFALLAFTSESRERFSERFRDRIEDRIGRRSVAEMEFTTFIANYGRRFGTKEEYEYRLDIFTLKYNLIQYHNSRPSSYKLGINRFMDFSREEWNDYLTYVEEGMDESRIVGSNGLEEGAPEYFSWKDTGALTDVKDQASCGACWAFTAAETLESAYFIKTGDLHILSTQQLVDCSKEYGNMGCFGGLFKNAFEYTVDYPLMDEKDYPYEGKSMGTECRYDPELGQVQATGYHFVKPKDPQAMLEHVLRQPLSVGIQANTMYFQMYKSGVLDDDKCGGENIDHAVQLIGYGFDEDLGKPYWHFRNQWGKGWGEEGFFRVLRDTEAGGIGVCGIQKRILYPDV